MKKLFILLFLLSFCYSKELAFEYFIQVNSTKNKDTLYKIEEKIRNLGYSYITKERTKKDLIYYRVLIGPYKTKDLANKDLPILQETFNNKTAYVSKFRVVDENSKIIIELKEAGYKAYLSRNFRQMNKYLEEAAALKDKESQYYIAKNYHYAIGIEQNIENAIKWYEKCMDSDYRCLEGLASIYSDYTLDRKPELEKGFTYLEKASKMGSKRAKAQLENRENIEKVDKLLKAKEISLRLIETFLYNEISIFQFL